MDNQNQKIGISKRNIFPKKEDYKINNLPKSAD